MKVLTLTQPWATLVAIGAKQWETRSKKVPSTCPMPFDMAIHAGIGPGADTKSYLRGLCEQRTMADALKGGGYERHGKFQRGNRLWDLLPHGTIIAVVTVTACYSTSDARFSSIPFLVSREWTFGDYLSGRFAWKLENVRRLAEPIPAKGMLGLWEYPTAEIERALEGVSV